MCKKLMDKSPLKYNIVKGATCLDPEVMLNESLRKSRITAALEVLIEVKRVLPSDADIISREYHDLCAKKDVKTKLASFVRETDRLDVVLHSILEQETVHHAFKNFVQTVLCLCGSREKFLY
jgi:TusA-related sulfurtransferase